MRGWSLADLAGRSAVAKATISKIERREMSPTAATLVKLAGAFDLTLAGLLLRAEDAPLVQRAGERGSWTDPASGYRRSQLFASPLHPLELVSVDLPPGARVTLPASSYVRIRQVVHVEAGSLAVDQGGAHTRLGTGDSLGFGPPTDVTFANETGEPCRYLVALCRT